MFKTNRRAITLLTGILALMLILSACSNGDGGPGISKTDFLFNLKNEYIGDAPATLNLIQALEISDIGAYTISLQTDAKPYALTVDFTKVNIDTDGVNAAMEKYSLILLALIANADEIHWSLPESEPSEIKSVSVDDANKDHGNIKEYAASADSLHSLLVSIDYYK